VHTISNFCTQIDQKVSNFSTQIDQKALSKMDADRPQEDRDADQKVSNFSTQIHQKALHKVQYYTTSSTTARPSKSKQFQHLK
jgi:hypothetical protein